MTLVWVLTAWFVWYSSSTAWQADIRLGYFATQTECEAAGAQLDPRERYRWEGMEAGPAWLRGWRCEREETAETRPTHRALVGTGLGVNLIDTARMRAVYLRPHIPVGEEAPSIFYGCGNRRDC